MFVRQAPCAAAGSGATETKPRTGAVQRWNITSILLFLAPVGWAMVCWLKPCTLFQPAVCVAPAAGIRAEVCESLGTWDVAAPGWSTRATEKLDNRSLGAWGTGNSSPPYPVWLSPNPHTSPSMSSVHRCLKHRWIMMHGDSSLRFMFSSLIHLVGNADVAGDRFMPKHLTCPAHADCEQYMKGFNANRTETGNTHEHYFREFWDRDQSIRITFTFKQQLSTRHLSLESFITDSMQPDLLVLQAGAWNLYSGVSVDQSMEDLMAFMRDVRLLYAGPIVWVNLPACWPNFKEFAAEFNRRTRATLMVPILDRQTSTQSLPEGLLQQCEGWHPYGRLSDMHRDWLLEAICEE